VPLAHRKFAGDMAAAITQSIFNLVGTKPPASGEKRPREHEDEMVEVGFEQDDIADDMIAFGVISNGTVHVVARSVPDNLTAPEIFWPDAKDFYLQLRALYELDRKSHGDQYSLYLTMLHGWARTLPLHVLIGKKYRTPILRLPHSGFYFWTQTESEEANFAITGMKFYFSTEGQCKSALDIIKAKNVALKNANPTGQISKAITMQYPDGQPIRLPDKSGKLCKEFIKLPFLQFGTSPRCTHDLSCTYDYVSTWYMGSHTRLSRSHPPLLPPPSLGYNNTTARRMHLIVQLTPKGGYRTTPTPLLL